MSDDQELLTIGRLSRRTGMPVRTIRYWSDIGALPPAGRSGGGYRLYDAASVARLELIRTLRELGLGLEEVRRILERETTVAAVAAVHVEALDAQIRTLRLRRAVLGTVAKRQSDTEEMTLLNQLARLSADERRRIVEEFVDEVFEGLDADPDIEARMRRTPADLPDDPTPEQVDAWVELAELVRDPDFRRHMRTVVEHNAAQHPAPGASVWFARKVVGVVGAARDCGVAPGAAEAEPVLTEILGADADRAAVLARLEAGMDGRAERYRQLLAVLGGEPPRPTHVAEFHWLAEALRAHP
ncbi:MerR family transcriptional regulator [Actinacidiphila glaucinigra]|uniref:DNA-binding transcriptional regulator, MerR family n=1 Tax=Actinacidiphila glaucinigra TaxID=235986 RepID=A0A239D7C2_9ACTN|nr:MerR family transcriptional regulator [Actinacidiphila glaucinigra]SNS27751.1 DNA-binding transcriptional regulator, MerR family [Actinacidiphila glaucinigra]